MLLLMKGPIGSQFVVGWSFSSCAQNESGQLHVFWRGGTRVRTIGMTFCIGGHRNGEISEIFRTKIVQTIFEFKSN
uniref:Uncharacterized protein n=1 Tax=Oryza brachyantha TaxID=4533 RepID=J3MVR4_ORYBR